MNDIEKQVTTPEEQEQTETTAAEFDFSAEVDKSMVQLRPGQTITGKVCSHCGYGAFNLDPSRAFDICPACGNPFQDGDSMKDLYGIEAVETVEAKRITAQDEDRERRGFDMLTTYSFPGDDPAVMKTTRVGPENSPLATLGYVPSATLWKINRGLRRRSNPNELGFRINPATGQWIADDEDAPPGSRTFVVPYVKDVRNVLLFVPPEEICSSQEAMSTLCAALQRGIAQTFQLEPSELQAEYLPNQDNPTRLLIYEASEGGAGALARLVDPAERARVFAAIAGKALEIMHYHLDTASGDYKENADAPCEAGCYACLLSYYNQPQHDRINRRNKDVLEYLSRLADVRSDDFTDLSAAPRSAPAGSFLDELRRHGVREPDRTDFDVRDPADSNRSIRAEAFYDLANVIVLPASAPSQDLSLCSDLGMTVLVRPAGSDGADAFFDSLRNAVGPCLSPANS